MTNEPNKPQTMFALAQAEAELQATGRFAQQRPQINGTSPVVMPTAIPQWAADFALCNDPDPLGYEINQLIEQPVNDAVELSAEFTPDSAPEEPPLPKPSFRRF